jgi:hypothetical protein
MNFRGVAGNGKRCKLGMTDYNGCNGQGGARQIQNFLALGSVQEALREANPTGTKCHGVGFEHEILRRERTVLNRPRRRLACCDHDQRWCAIENVEVRIGEHGVELVTLLARFGCGEQMALRFVRYVMQVTLIADDSKNLGLSVHGARRLDGGMNHLLDENWIDGRARK